MDAYPPARGLADIQDLSMGDYGELTKAKTDLDLVATYCRLVGIALPTKAAAYVALLSFVTKGIRVVRDAFAAVPGGGLSADEVMAGFGSRNFGLFGVVDRIARRQGITDEQARAMSVATIVGKLTIDGHLNECQKRLNTIWRQRQTAR